ncbi:MAG: DNA methyltransferase [Chloroflexi bacterium]|nr:DNA methyltransferase [Chloroflexota bacterium]MCY4246890.1 DNA methyltransferase [Chloroflexota bacterium]
MPDQATPNRLHFGDCLEIMAEYIPDESVDLIYLDPPFNSKRIYNAFIGGAQWVAFDDTWRWYEAIDDFHAVARDVSLAPTMEGLRRILGEGGELAYLSYMANRLRECWRVLKPTGSIYLHCDPTMNYLLRLVMNAVFGKENYRNEIVWSYRRWPAKQQNFQRMHDTIFRYSRSNTVTWNQLYEPLAASTLQAFGRKKQVADFSTGRRLPRQLETESPGAPMRDVWHISIIAPSAKERLGYPTQKPLALLNRIIQASSNPGDVVFDPFCGCGTTIHAAQNLGRRWIGIDVCVQACKVIQKRIESHMDTLWDDIEFVGMPKTLEDARELAAYDPFKFERWAASLTPGLEANKRQRGDKGIDGRGRLPVRKGRFIDVVAQVKAGNSNPSHVQAFNEARRQAGAELGIFTCFADKVTRGMRNAGKYLDKWPVIQIYTIEDYFAGQLPDLPLGDFPRP